MAELCGVGNQLVGEIRELCDSHSSKVRVGKDGKTRKNPVHQVKVAQNKPQEIKNQPGGLLPTTPEKPTAGVSMATHPADDSDGARARGGSRC